MLSNSGIQKMSEIGLLPFFFMLLVSLLVSLFISHLYLKFYGTKGTGSTLHRSFPLIGVAITSIFVSLQFSIPLSLGLLGALSIVRFRTPIKDPEEVGFILLVIATSLTCATFNIPFLVIIMLVALIGLIILRFDKKFFTNNKHEGMLIFKTTPNNTENIIEAVHAKLKHSKVDSIVEENGHVTMSFAFAALKETDLVDLNKSISNIDSGIEKNVFYNHPLT
ncbi:MAG: DUF4956 domain-containing protein [Halobacteriovoraceae bacterium]|nr:DUF4956 domain-containing protein [Halobacteriovoraceae bacterium]|tara:strand:+ start:25226 stop:25891 length:666 start_codon:yes stop_codon:yes gene_type:complete